MKKMIFYNRLWVLGLAILMSGNGYASNLMQEGEEESSMIKNSIYFEYPELGQHFMIGFQGVTPEDEGTQQVLKWAQEGLIGGVIFFKHNLINRSQICNLLGAFQALKPQYPLLLAVDQEGGLVQRLSSHNGFSNYPSATEVAEKYTSSKACELYTKMAGEVKEAGFNLVLGPVVDLYSPESRAIGKLKRSYGRDPDQVVDYAKSFIQAFSSQNILTCLKHFPGHGLALNDSHKGFVDITSTYHLDELKPFQRLVEEGDARILMSAHVINQKYSPDPATLTPNLRNTWEISNDVAFISDDMVMGAIIDNFSLEQATVKAIGAGIDIVLVSRNPKASQGQEKLNGNLTPLDLARFVLNALEKGALKLEELHQSLNRIKVLKAGISGTYPAV